MPVGAAIAGSALSAYSSKRAGDKQASAAAKAGQMSERQFDVMRADTAPYRQVGSNALYRLGDLLGVGPATQSTLRPPRMPDKEEFRRSGKKARKYGAYDTKKYEDAMNDYDRDISKYQADVSSQINAGPQNRNMAQSILESTPGYQFRLSEGQRQLDRMQSASGVTGGRAVKEAMRYGQDYASNEFSNTTDQLYRLAGLGSNQVNTSVSAGQNSAAMSGNAAMAGGEAAANKYAGFNNAVQGGLDNYMTIRSYNDWQKRMSPATPSYGYSTSGAYSG